MTGGGVANLQPVPFQPGHDLSVKHGFYRSPEHFTAEQLAELDARAAYLRELSPVYSETLEPTVQRAALMQALLVRGGAELLENGVVRAKGEAAPILKRWEALDAKYDRALEKLGIGSAAGVVVSAEELRRLAPEELRTLRALVAKAVRS